MTQFFTASERSNFEALGWEVCGSSAYIHFDALALGISVEADGGLMIQRRCEDGRWRWVERSQHETALLAACTASDLFYRWTGWELFSRKGA